MRLRAGSALPAEDAIDFIVGQFRRAERECPKEIAERIVQKVHGYPFYVQKIPYAIYEVSDGDRPISESDFTSGLLSAIEEEKATFEGWLRSLAPRQIGVLRAIAGNPTDQPYAFSYLSKHSIGNAATVRKSINKLLDLDYIERQQGVFMVTDPIFALWLTRGCGVAR